MSDPKSTDHTHSIFSVPFVLTVISACGVVYGDIGTSVLYTFREIFFGHDTYGQVPITQDHILVPRLLVPRLISDHKIFQFCLVCRS